MRPIVAASLLLIGVLSALLLWTSNNFDQTDRYTSKTQNSLHNSTRLEMTFAHADHVRQQCVVCHHNYQDDTGQGLCLECHHSNPAIAFKVRDQFHQLCMGCHTEKRDDGEVSGPLRNCKACHTVDYLP